MIDLSLLNCTLDALDKSAMVKPAPSSTLQCKSYDWLESTQLYTMNKIDQIRQIIQNCMCDTEAKMPTIRKTMKTINMRARRISITTVISSGALSVNTKKKKKKKKYVANTHTVLFIILLAIAMSYCFSLAMAQRIVPALLARRKTIHRMILGKIQRQRHVLHDIAWCFLDYNVSNLFEWWHFLIEVVHTMKCDWFYCRCSRIY